MNTKILALALFAATATAVAYYPQHQKAGVAAPPVTPTAAPPTAARPPTNRRPVVELVFALDTTGSMSGLIEAAKEKIWSIATTLASTQPAPEIKIGLVAYRDRGDAYVTRVVDLSEDLDSVYATLMEFRAEGGGDGPESVNQALDDTVNKITWSQDPDTYKVVFLVGDAPPHMDYQDDVKYPDTLATAVGKGIVVNTIQCGTSGGTTPQWQRIAQLGQGNYFQVEQAGGAVALATPFDEKLAKLSAKLDDTRLYYGDETEKKKRQLKVETANKLHAASSVESRARRAEFNTSESGKANFLGEGELVDDVIHRRVDLSTLDRDQLPEPLQNMAPEQREAAIRKTAKERDELQQQIRQLAGQRSTYLNEKVGQMGGAKDSLDHQIYATVREQAEEKGLRYEAAAPAY